MGNNELILRNNQFREDIVDLINNYNDIPAFVRKQTVREVYQQLELVEQQELNNAQEEKSNENTEEEKKGENA